MAKKTTQSMKAPKPENDGQDYQPFFKLTTLSSAELKRATKDHIVVTLRGKLRTQDSQYGKQLVVSIMHNGKTYDWPVRINSGNHARLFTRFGDNGAKWRGAVKLSVREFNGQDYLAVVD